MNNTREAEVRRKREFECHSKFHGCNYAAGWVFSSQMIFSRMFFVKYAV